MACNVLQRANPDLSKFEPEKFDDGDKSLDTYLSTIINKYKTEFLNIIATKGHSGKSYDAIPMRHEFHSSFLETPSNYRHFSVIMCNSGLIYAEQIVFRGLQLAQTSCLNNNDEGLMVAALCFIRALKCPSDTRPLDILQGALTRIECEPKSHMLDFTEELK